MDTDPTLEALRETWPLEWRRDSSAIWRAPFMSLTLAVERVAGFPWGTSARKSGQFVHADGNHDSATEALRALRAALPEALAREAARLRAEADDLEKVRASMVSP